MIPPSDRFYGFLEAADAPPPAADMIDGNVAESSTRARNSIPDSTGGTLLSRFSRTCTGVGKCTVE